MKHLRTAVVVLFVLSSIAAAQQTGKNCNKSSVGLTPLNDLAAGSYKGFQGGLYPGGDEAVPASHFQAGLARGASIVPLAKDGSPNLQQGEIVLLTIGMSNTAIESISLVQAYSKFPNHNLKVTIVNGAQGGQSAAIIADPNAAYWNDVQGVLQQNLLTPEQVQVVWLKQSDADPVGQFPLHAQDLAANLEAIVNILHDNFPNLKQCYVSSRIYGGYSLGSLSPEPYAYESGFSVKWLIQSQIQGKPSLNFRPNAGPVEAPWLAWGAYMWADGLVPRSDGLTWECDDFQEDGTHPSSVGAGKVAAFLISEFADDPTSRPWFVQCEADLDNSGDLNVFDFLSFFNLFSADDPLSDCDRNMHHDLFDLLCYQNRFASGCSFN